MHVSGFHVDFSAFLQFVVTAAVIAVGLIQLVKATASKYFVVDAKFDGGAGENFRGDRMASSGTAGSEDLCFICRKPGSKKCSRCKSVRYCSTTCQSKHWILDHKNHCKDLKLLDSRNSIVSGSSSCGRRASGWVNTFTSTSSSVAAHGTYEELKQPQKVLFPYDQFVELFKCKSTGFPPCGLLNCGNSCFANVVLQCLSCTRPLVVYLLEEGHTRGCSRNDWCFLCELQCHIQRVTKSLHPFSPINILSRLPSIGGNLGCGKQEDAHEFMRFVIDTMQSVCLDEFGGEKSLDLSTQQTTLIQHMFGGHLQSQVICTACGKISYRYENMMDLTVEIQGDAASLEDCLEQFTVKEWLDGENMYKCDRCNDYVKAWKRLTVHQPPNILTIALKRFQSGRFGKLNKRVTFPETLDLGPYMSDTRENTDLYALYAVVVHVDMLNASFFGHYICYTKDFCGNWYRVDDCKVMKVELKEVLTQGAYMLLYNRVHVREPCVKPLEPATWEKDQQSMEVSLDTVCSPVKSVVSSGISDFVNSGSIRGISDRLTGSSYESQSTAKFGPEPIVEESVEMELVYPVKVASIGDSKDVLLGSHGLIDDREEHNCHSKALEDVSSVEFMNIQPAIAVSRGEPSLFQSNAGKCKEQTVSPNVEPDFHDEKVAMGNEQRNNHLCEDSSNNYLTSNTSEASSSGTLPADSSLSESSNEDRLIPQVSNPVMEQAVLTRNPLISQSGTTRLVRKVSGSFADLNVCAKPKPIFSPGFLDGRMRKKNLSNMEKSQTEPMDIYAPLNSNGFVECSFSRQNGSGVNQHLKEDERFGKENGWASPNFHKESGSDVYTHEVEPTLCGQGEDMELDCKNPFQYVHLDENQTVTESMNEVEKNGVSVHFDACRLETNCNGFSAHDNADHNGINGSETCLDYDGPITNPYFLDETMRSKAHKQQGGPNGYSPKLNNPCFTEENGSRDCNDVGVTTFRQNEKDVHLSYKRLKQEEADSTDVELNHD